MIRLAIPSVHPGGLDANRAGHFGHCDAFTILEVDGTDILKVEILANQEHSQGGCMVPVNLLRSNNVNAIIVGGIGMRPLMGFRQVGIDVYHEATEPRIRPVVEQWLEGRVPLISEDQVCGGAAG